jgi:hypothetical protein
VVFASQAGASLDSDVLTGGGTDDTAVLQAVLDQAPERGNLHLVIDGAALVRGLDVHSNTTIECLNPGCGFFLADGADRSILRNANPSRTERHDRNITLIGGTYNHNCLKQVHHLSDNTWVVGLQFFGVENLTVHDLTIRNQRTFAMFLTNWFRVTMENIYIDLPDRVQCWNQDGIHFQGPGQFLTMRNIQGCSWDDFIALNADDCNGSLQPDGSMVYTDVLGPYASVGPITDVLIDGVVLNDAAQGIRLLTRASRMDRIVIRNVTGTYRSFGFYISPWLKQDPDAKVTDGGNFGFLNFDTIDLRPSEPNYDYFPPFLFHLDGHIESLNLRNLQSHQPVDPRPLVHVTESAHVGAITVDGLEITESDGAAADARYVRVEGEVEDLVVRAVQVRRGSGVPVEGALVEVGSGAGEARVERLVLDGVSVRRMRALVSQEGGTVGVVKLSGVLAQDMGGPLVQSSAGTIGEVYADAVHGAEVR